MARQLGDRKELIRIVRSMPDIAVVASCDEIAALAARRFEDPLQESLLYRLKFGLWSSGVDRHMKIRHSMGALMITIAGSRSFSGVRGWASIGWTRPAPWISPQPLRKNLELSRGNAWTGSRSSCPPATTDEFSLACNGESE